VFQYVVKSSCAPAPVPADSASGHRSGQRARPSAQAAAARQVGGQPGARSSGGHQACHRVRMLKSLGNLLHSPISIELSCHTALLVGRSGQASPPADVTSHPQAERGAARGLRLQGGTKPVGSRSASSAHASAAFFQARRVRAWCLSCYSRLHVQTRREQVRWWTMLAVLCRMRRRAAGEQTPAGRRHAGQQWACDSH